jgi:hypothetical protein
MERHVRDLPGPVVRSIVSRARGRLIPGTNRFAAVCRSWRDETSSGNDEEGLQPLLCVHQVQPGDLEACLAWLQQHGGCVTSLSVTGPDRSYWPDEGLHGLCWPFFSRLLVAPTAFGPHLTRLELQGKDTLLPLAPHLQQLPALQHLGASTTMKYMFKKKGFFCRNADRGKRAARLPDLEQLCPQLVSLHLTVHNQLCDNGSRYYAVDARLSDLLPVGLQRLHLAGDWACIREMDCARLTHLTALDHLTLQGVIMTHQEHLAGMSRLQKLELWRSEIHPAHLPSLASKLVGYWGYGSTLCPGMLCQLTALTALAFTPCECNHGTGPEPAVNPLLSLASLRHLFISFEFLHANTLFLEGLGGLSSLRSLRISGALGPSVLEQVAGATQLTHLGLGFWSNDPLPDADGPQVLQQLTGLQRLDIHSHYLVSQAEVLTALQQLTHLVVMQASNPPHGAPKVKLEDVCAAVAGRLPKLQKLVSMDWGGRDLKQASRFFGLYGEGLDKVVPSPLPGVQVLRGTLHMRDPGDMSEHAALLRPRQTRPCPHLPGVLEVVAPDQPCQ